MPAASKKQMREYWAAIVAALRAGPVLMTDLEAVTGLQPTSIRRYLREIEAGHRVTRTATRPTTYVIKARTPADFARVARIHLEGLDVTESEGRALADILGVLARLEVAR